MPENPSNDPFHFHKVALRPLLHPLDDEETTTLFKTLESFELNEFVAFLYRQGLAQLWLEFLLKQDSLPKAFEKIINSLKQDWIKGDGAAREEDAAFQAQLNHDPNGQHQQWQWFGQINIQGTETPK